jgi:hypothetical protein
MRELQDSDSLFSILVVAAAFVIAKVLAWLGLLTKENSSKIATGLSIVVGVVYAVSFEFQRPMGGPVAEFVLRILFGAFVGGVLWVFILMGVGGAAPDNDKKK